MLARLARTARAPAYRAAFSTTRSVAAPAAQPWGAGARAAAFLGSGAAATGLALALGGGVVFAGEGEVDWQGVRTMIEDIAEDDRTYNPSVDGASNGGGGHPGPLHVFCFL